MKLAKELESERVKRAGPNSLSVGSDFGTHSVLELACGFGRKRENADLFGLNPATGENLARA